MARPVFIIWHGGTNYSESTIEDLERFDSLADAVEALKSRDRFGHGWRQTFNYVFRDERNVFTPVCDDARIDVYFRDNVEDMRDPYGVYDDIPDRTISLTPRGAARDEAGRYYR